MDNIAVNRDYEAIFVDLENVIVVDKNPTEKGIDKLINIQNFFFFYIYLFQLSLFFSTCIYFVIKKYLLKKKKKKTTTR